MTNLSIKRNRKEYTVHSLTLVEDMDSFDNRADKKWFKSIIKSIFVKNDLNLETFDRIEMKKTIQPTYDYFN